MELEVYPPMARATREHPQTQQLEASKTLTNHAVLAADRPVIGRATPMTEVKHSLTVTSLHDAQAQCVCGWSYSFTGARTRDQIHAEFSTHLRASGFAPMWTPWKLAPDSDPEERFILVNAWDMGEEHPEGLRFSSAADASAFLINNPRFDSTQHNGDTITRLSDLVDGTADDINATIERLNHADIPNDPEEMNEARAAWAAYALAAFGASHRSDPDSLVPDLLCNLRHWCDRNGQDFDAELARGNMHYEAEIAAEVQP